MSYVGCYQVLALTIIMHLHRRKHSSEVFEMQLHLLKSECPNLGVYSAQQSDLFPESIISSFMESIRKQGCRKLKNLGCGPNAPLRGFYYYCFKSIYDLNNKDLLERFKQELYPPQRNLTTVTNIPAEFSKLSSTQMKKLMVEFIHVLSYCSDKNKVQLYLNRYPVVEVVMILLLRTILRDCNIDSADQYDKPVDWVDAFVALGDIFGVQLKFTSKMQVCEFSDRQFFLVRENDSFFMVWQDRDKTEKIDLDKMEFDSVSVSQPSDRQCGDKSDGSTPKFKLYITNQKKRRRSHKNSFGGQVDTKAYKDLASSSILNTQTAFGQIIRKHRLSEDDNSSATFQKFKKPVNVKQADTKKSQKQRKESKSPEKPQKPAAGPRFIQNPEPINLDLSEYSQVYRSQRPSACQQPPKQSNPAPVFRWDERSTFSNLAGMSINQKMNTFIQEEQRLSSQNHIQTASIYPTSPTSNTLEGNISAAFNTNNFLIIPHHKNDNISNIASEMTDSAIIELLEPSVRESLKMRKCSMNTDVLLWTDKKTEPDPRSSLMIENRLPARKQKPPFMSDSVVGVVNMQFNQQIAQSNIGQELDKPFEGSSMDTLQSHKTLQSDKNNTLVRKSSKKQSSKKTSSPTTKVSTPTHPSPQIKYQSYKVPSPPPNFCHQGSKSPKLRQNSMFLHPSQQHTQNKPQTAHHQVRVSQIPTTMNSPNSPNGEFRKFTSVVPQSKNLLRNVSKGITVSSPQIQFTYANNSTNHYNSVNTFVKPGSAQLQVEQSFPHYTRNDLFKKPPIPTANFVRADAKRVCNTNTNTNSNTNGGSNGGIQLSLIKKPSLEGIRSVTIRR